MTMQRKLLVSLVIPVMVTMAVLSIAVGTAAAAGWRDDFDGTFDGRTIDGTIVDEGHWTIEYEGRPGQLFVAPGRIPGEHRGYFLKEHVTLSLAETLSLRLTQVEDDVEGVISWGALIFTNETYGYGTYEWRMRMSSTATPDDPFDPLGSPKSGSVSAGFIYVSNSQTEIDFEYLAWLHNSTNEVDIFMIERCTVFGKGKNKSCNFDTSWTVPKNSTTYPDTSVAGGTTYRYRVKARNANGDSPYSNIAQAKIR